MPHLPALKRLFNALLFVALTGAVAVPSWAAGKAVAVPERVSGIALAIDGYTVEIGKEQVRLSGILVPEMKEPRGPEARAEMDKIIAGRELVCEISGRGAKELIGGCRVNGLDVAEELIRRGRAFVWRIDHRRYGDVYVVS